MKKIFRLFCAVVAIASLAASCSEPKGEELEQLKNETVVLTAGYSDDATRTTLNASFAPLWEKGDLLYASDGTNLVSAAVPEANDGRGDATFEFTGLTANADEYCCFYNGGGDVTRVDATHFTLTLASTGKWSTAHAAIGKANAKGFVKLRNVSTAVSFTTSREDIYAVTLSGLIDDDEFPTVATVNMADSTLANVDVATSLTATVGNTPGTYYFGFFPVDGISGLKLSIQYGSESSITQVKEITINGTFNFKGANILDLGNIDDHAGKTYGVVQKTGFDAVSGTIAEGFTYAAFKGNANTAPAINSNVIRLYQPKSAGDYGGYIEITSTGGDMITGLHLDISNNTTVTWTVDDAAVNVADSVAVKYNTGVNISNLNCAKVTVYGVHPNSNNRLYVKGIRVTYVPDTRTPQTLSFPEAAYTAILGTPFTAPDLTGVQTTVTYTSSNTDVATVDAATGAVTLRAAGTTKITAKAAESPVFKPGTASYDLTVAAPVSGVVGIKTAIDHNTSSPFAATLTGAIVTFVQADYPYTVYLEQDGVAVYLYNAFGNAKTSLNVGDKIDGLVTGAGIRYNAATLEVTSFDYTGAVITPDQTLPLATVTIAQLKENYATYEYRRVKVENAVVTDALTTSDQDGKIAQGTDTIAIRAQIKNTIAIEAGTNIDLLTWPVYYYNSSAQTTTNQLAVWAQADITVKGGTGIITMPSTKDLTVGGSWEIGATCNSGATITYTSSNTEVATVDPATGVVNALKAGQTTITATAPAANDFTAAEATCLVTVSAAGANSYSLYSGTLVEGDYIIVYGGKAMNTTVSSDRLQYSEPTITNDQISDPDASIIWHIAQSGDYWTLFNAAANKYAAGTGAKNKAQMLASGTDDKALWTVTGTSTYEFVNKANAAKGVNANLRNNGTYGFACYATSTGGPLSLYKKN